MHVRYRTTYYYDDRELFSKALDNCEGAKEKYDLNNKLINMRLIPDDLSFRFYRNYD